MNSLRFRKTIILASLAAPDLVMAASPVGYDGWSVTNGNIDTTASCTGVTCTTLTADNGFLQQEVDTGTYKYIRLILTDPGASGNPTQLAYTSESLIPFAVAGAGFQQGLAAKQVIRDAADGFESIAEVQKADFKRLGSATPADMFNIRLSQTTAQATTTSSFNYVNYTASGFPDTNTVIGHKTDITFSVLTGDPGDTTKKTVFDYRERAGRDGQGNVFFGGSNPISTAGSTTLNGTTVSWADTSAVSSTWIAQSDVLKAGAAGFVYQGAANLTTSATANEFALDVPEPASPFDWNATTTANFGPAPTFP